LKKLRFRINDTAVSNGYLVLSGIRDFELDDLLCIYGKMHYKRMWTDCELGWAAVVLRRFT
jgi:hypothetical protein